MQALVCVLLILVHKGIGDYAYYSNFYDDDDFGSSAVTKSVQVRSKTISTTDQIQAAVNEILSERKKLKRNIDTKTADTNNTDIKNTDTNTTDIKNKDTNTTDIKNKDTNTTDIKKSEIKKADTNITDTSKKPDATGLTPKAKTSKKTTTKKPRKKVRKYSLWKCIKRKTLPTCVIPTKPPSTTTTTVKTTIHFDVAAFLDLVANLTYDYYTNLTDQLNMTLIKMKAPTCPTRSKPDYDDFNSTFRGRCYVCGLDTPGIPLTAECSDAFAGEFIAIIPIDVKAKQYIKTFRKNCFYKDVNNYVYNSTMPRSIFGRFTGGCAVRWTDVSSVYTQRTCRSRIRPMLGQHFVSKRMAKLEMALVMKHNACIISPAASLIPLSRGISLYARFHVCVCSGNFCNQTARTMADLTFAVILAAIFACVTQIT